MRNLIIVLIAGIIVLSWAMMISHAPLFETSQTERYSEARTIPDAKRPWAIFGTIKDAPEIDYYTFVAKDAMKLKLALLVPSKEALEAFRPSVVLIGPGITGESSLIEELPPVSGAMEIIPSEDDYTKTLRDKFTFISYREGPTHEIEISETGRYYLAVIPNEGGAGDYVLRIGEEEDISFMNVIGAFFSWFKIQWMHWR